MKNEKQPKLYKSEEGQVFLVVNAAFFAQLNDNEKLIYLQKVKALIDQNLEDEELSKSIFDDVEADLRKPSPDGVITARGDLDEKPDSFAVIVTNSNYTINEFMGVKDGNNFYSPVQNEIFRTFCFEHEKAHTLRLEDGGADFIAAVAVLEKYSKNPEAYQAAVQVLRDLSVNRFFESYGYSSFKAIDDAIRFYDKIKDARMSKVECAVMAWYDSTYQFEFEGADKPLRLGYTDARNYDADFKVVRQNVYAGLKTSDYDTVMFRLFEGTRDPAVWTEAHKRTSELLSRNPPVFEEGSLERMYLKDLNYALGIYLSENYPNNLDKKQQDAQTVPQRAVPLPAPLSSPNP